MTEVVTGGGRVKDTLGGGIGVVGAVVGGDGGGGSVEVVLGGQPCLHDVTVIVDVVNEIYVVESLLIVTGQVVNVV